MGFEPSKKEDPFPKKNEGQLGSMYVKTMIVTYISHLGKDLLWPLVCSLSHRSSPQKIHEEMPKLARQRGSRSTRRCKHSWRTQRVHERQQAYLGKTTKKTSVLYSWHQSQNRMSGKGKVLLFGCKVCQDCFFSAFLVKQFVRIDSFPTIQSPSEARFTALRSKLPRSFHWCKGNRWIVVDGGYWLPFGYDLSTLQSTSTTIHLVFTSTPSGLLLKSWKLHPSKSSVDHQWLPYLSDIGSMHVPSGSNQRSAAVCRWDLPKRCFVYRSTLLQLLKGPKTGLVCCKLLVRCTMIWYDCLLYEPIYLLIALTTSLLKLAWKSWCYPIMNYIWW